MNGPRECPLCHQTDLSIQFENASFALLMCRSCRLYWADARGESGSGSLLYNSHYYARNYLKVEEPQRKFFESELLRLARMVPGKRVLDVGFGAGLFIDTAQQQGWDVSGIEASSDAARMVQRRLGDRARFLAQGEFLSTPFPHQDYDLICFWDVLAHLPDPRAYLERALKLLTKGGVLVVKTPARSDNFFLAVKRLPSWVRESLVHWPSQRYYFDPVTFKVVLPAMGYSIVGERVVPEVKSQPHPLWEYWNHPRGALLAGAHKYYDHRYVLGSRILYARRP